MNEPDSLRGRFVCLSPHLDERARRLWAATESKVLGPGGARVASAATGIAVSTTYRGLEQLASGETLDDGRLRRPGAGRKTLLETGSSLIADLLALVEPDARGDPSSPSRRTSKGLRRLAAESAEQGHRVSHTVVGERLKRRRFSLQANVKTREGSDNPDRDAQFGVINAAVKAALAEGRPVISVDTKKKELVGDFKNDGRERRPQGEPEEVRVHDVLIEEPGRAVPYGIYDLAADAGWVSVGMDHDASAFAVDTIRRWWIEVGRPRCPEARRLVITADGGGSNGSRVRLWKIELQALATELGIDIEVHHRPPGTSKWNRIEHKLVSFIRMNWRVKPLVKHCVIVSLIGATTTTTGLTVRCELDEAKYPKGIIVSEQQMQAIIITRSAFHGEWNYTIHPRNEPRSSFIASEALSAARTAARRPKA